MRDLIQLTVANGGTSILGFARGAILAVLLGVRGYGVYLFISALVAYGQHAHFGAFYGLYRELPYQRERGRADILGPMTDAAAAGGYLGTALFAVGASTVLSIWLPDREPKGLLLLLFVGVVGLQSVDGLAGSVARGELRYGRISTAQLAQAAVRLVAVAPLAWLWGVPGALVSDALGRALSWRMLAAGTRLRPVLRRAQVSAARPLLLSGLSILLIALAQTALLTVDRFIIAGGIGERALGLYGLAILSATALVAVASSVNTYVYPHLSGLVGAAAPPEKLTEVVRHSTRSSVLVSVAVAMFGMLLLPLVVQLRPFADYAEGVPAAVILLAGTAVLGVVGPAVSLLNAERNILDVALLQGLAILASGGLSWYLGVVRDMGIEGVAIGSAIALLLYGMCARFALRVSSSAQPALSDEVPLVSALATLAVVAHQGLTLEMLSVGGFRLAVAVVAGGLAVLGVLEARTLGRVLEDGPV